MAVGAPSLENSSTWPASALFKPLTAIGDPPRNKRDRDDCKDLPPEWQPEGGDLQGNDNQPEHSSLHSTIVGERERGSAATFFRGIRLLYKMHETHAARSGG